MGKRPNGWATGSHNWERESEMPEMVNFSYKSEFRIEYALEGCCVETPFVANCSATEVRVTGYPNGENIRFGITTQAQVDYDDRFNPTIPNPSLQSHGKVLELIGLALTYANKHLVLQRFLLDKQHIEIGNDYYEVFNAIRASEGHGRMKQVTSTLGFIFHGQGTMSASGISGMLRVLEIVCKSDEKAEILKIFQTGLMSNSDPFKEWWLIIEFARSINHGGQPLIHPKKTIVQDLDYDFLQDFPQVYRHHREKDKIGIKSAAKWKVELDPANADTTKQRYIGELSKLIDFYFFNC